MTKTYETLVQDIEGILSDGVDAIYSDFLNDFGDRVSRIVQEKLKPRDRVPTLRMSNIGTPCSRKLWYLINNPEKAEKLSPEAYLKFLFGDLTEEFLLFLAELAGHRVEGRQTEMQLAGIKGHRDVVIDGLLTDCKSASSFSFKKFKEHRLLEDDPFGYIDQIFGYLEGSKDDPLVTYKDRAGFLVMDKQHGHVCLDIYEKPEVDFEKVYEYRKQLVKEPEPPARHYEDEPHQQSGNRKLGLTCGYCDFKKHCWPGLRTFLYKDGTGVKPVFLTHVVREPNVFEVRDEEGDIDG